MNTDVTKALVVFSGGQDSTTCLTWALHRFPSVRALTFDYGQRHSAEVDAAVDVVAFLEHRFNRSIPHEVLELPAHTFASTSPLVDPDAELERYSDHDQMAAVIGDRIETTFVPMRNAVFLMLAANRAVAHGCGAIVTGICQADNANYPDCREVFRYASEWTANVALGADQIKRAVRILAPLMNKSKAQTVEMALAEPHCYAALGLSHTAYDGAFPPGNDHASVLRAHGFAEAGVPDPLILRANAALDAPLPTTDNYRGEAVKLALERLSK